jgi:hypothetical protein
METYQTFRQEYLTKTRRYKSHTNSFSFRLLAAFKKLIKTILFLVFLYAGSMNAKAPWAYQFIMRDHNNQLLTHQSVGVQITILKDSLSGTPVYRERHFPQTDSKGSVVVEIGSGNPLEGDFSLIDWKAGSLYITTETDPIGGSNYIYSNTSPLLSVPFAMHSRTAHQLSGIPNETDPLFSSGAASQITTNKKENWDEAYNWGNHTASYTRSSQKIDLGGIEHDLETNPVWQLGTVDSVTFQNGISGGTINTSGTIGLTGPMLSLHNLNNNGLIVRASDGQLYSRQLVAGPGIVITQNDIAPIINIKRYSVGDFAFGGIVFYVDRFGKHGLVCAITDQSTGVRWDAGSGSITFARDNGEYTGETNTMVIIATQGRGDGATYAAREATEYSIGSTSSGFIGGWYLPSPRELQLMYENRAAINAAAIANGGTAFANEIYWTSRETTSTRAWNLNFSTGSSSSLGAKSAERRVRAVRAF